MNRLATSWSQQLRSCEESSTAPPTRLTWLRRAYVRIYRFLIARYGDRPLAPVTPAPMPFVDATDELSRQPARTPGELQQVLKEIHAAQAPVVEASTAAADGWITVATRSLPQTDLPRAARLLGEDGLPARVRRQGGELCLQVPMKRRGEAFARLPLLPPAPVEQPRASEGWRGLLLVFVFGNMLFTLWLQQSLTLTADSRALVAASTVVMVIVTGLTVGVVLGAFQPRSTRGRSRTAGRSRRL